MRGRNGKDVYCAFFDHSDMEAFSTKAAAAGLETSRRAPLAPSKSSRGGGGGLMAAACRELRRSINYLWLPQLRGSWSLEDWAALCTGSCGPTDKWHRPLLLHAACAVLPVARLLVASCAGRGGQNSEVLDGAWRQLRAQKVYAARLEEFRKALSLNTSALHGPCSALRFLRSSASCDPLRLRLVWPGGAPPRLTPLWIGPVPLDDVARLAGGAFAVKTHGSNACERISVSLRASVDLVLCGAVLPAQWQLCRCGVEDLDELLLRPSLPGPMPSIKLHFGQEVSLPRPTENEPSTRFFHSRVVRIRVARVARLRDILSLRAASRADALADAMWEATWQVYFGCLPSGEAKTWFARCRDAWLRMPRQMASSPPLHAVHARAHLSRAQAATDIANVIMDYARQGGMSRFSVFKCAGVPSPAVHSAALLLSLLFPQDVSFDCESVVKVGVEPRGAVADEGGDFGFGTWWTRLRLPMFLQALLVGALDDLLQALLPRVIEVKDWRDYVGASPNVEGSFRPFVFVHRFVPERLDVSDTVLFQFAEMNVSLNFDNMDWFSLPRSRRLELGARQWFHEECTVPVQTLERLLFGLILAGGTSLDELEAYRFDPYVRPLYTGFSPRYFHAGGEMVTEDVCTTVFNHSTGCLIVVQNLEEMGW